MIQKREWRNHRHQEKSTKRGQKDKSHLVCGSAFRFQMMMNDSFCRESSTLMNKDGLDSEETTPWTDELDGNNPDNNKKQYYKYHDSNILIFDAGARG